MYPRARPDERGMRGHATIPIIFSLNLYIHYRAPRIIWHPWGLAKMSYKPIVILTSHFQYKKVLFGTKIRSYKAIVILSGVIIRGALYHTNLKMNDPVLYERTHASTPHAHSRCFDIIISVFNEWSIFNVHVDPCFMSLKFKRQVDNKTSFKFFFCHLNSKFTYDLWKVRTEF